jgi:hypothetical protein
MSYLNSFGMRDAAAPITMSAATMPAMRFHGHPVWSLSRIAQQAIKLIEQNSAMNMHPFCARLVRLAFGEVPAIGTC